MPVVTHENYIEKRLTSRELEVAEAVQRLRSEADLLEKLAVTGVTPALLARGEDAGGPWHRVARVNAPTVAEHGLVVKSGWLAPAFLALAAIHEATDDRGPLRVVHADLSPSNLAIDDAGKVTILDFDLASWRERRAPSDGAFRGTVRFTAPELAAGGLPTVQSDLFSMAASLAGRELRKGDAFAALLTLAAEVPVDTTGLHRALASCLAHDPAKRPASAREVAHQLGG